MKQQKLPETLKMDDTNYIDCSTFRYAATSKEGDPDGKLRDELVWRYNSYGSLKLVIKIFFATCIALTLAVFVLLTHIKTYQNAKPTTIPKTTTDKRTYQVLEKLRS